MSRSGSSLTAGGFVSTGIGRRIIKSALPSGKVWSKGLEGFRSFAKERLIKRHGVSRDRFPLYLKEMDFRSNDLKESLFAWLTQYPGVDSGPMANKFFSTHASQAWGGDGQSRPGAARRKEALTGG